ncbi:MAG: HAD family hydrolase [Thermoplasmata archaeon]|nr:HAD family hydrolase [Thermoplasmata archaeon]
MPEREMTERNEDAEYKACVFDFDGTVIDTMECFAATAAKVMEQSFGLERAEGRRLYLETSGLPFRLQLEEMFPDDLRNDEAAGVFERAKMRDITQARFFPEVKGIIDELRGRGILVAISSNNFAVNVNGLLGEAAIDVDLVLSYHPGFHKGDPHFLRILAHWGLEHSQVLYIGDSIKDALWAREYGVDFVARTGTAAREMFEKAFPEFRVVDDLRDVLSIVFPDSGSSE